jgi:hypothetical protein
VKWPPAWDLSIESQAAKRRLGGWCEMAASLGVKSVEALGRF